MNKMGILFLFSFSYAIDVTSGGVLSENQASYDVQHYGIHLKIDAKRKMISGYVDITLRVISDMDFIEIDLLNDYNVSVTEVDGMSYPFQHDKNKLTINVSNLSKNRVSVAHIVYKGKPPIAERPPWSGGFSWKESNDGYPWIAVSCQTNGAYIWYPCKEHPSDEPDSADIRISVPDPLSVASNGLLQSVYQGEPGWKTWHWKTRYNINTYNINFTVGHFDLVERTTNILGDPLKMEFYVLKEHTYGANTLLDQAEKHLEFYTRTFGQYPWIKEKFGLVQTPYWGMEHQTINAYGNNYKNTDQGYDFLMFHEMGHEWWGNYLSASDWADFWIHEGFVVYAEAIYLEEMFGEDAYHAFFEHRMKSNIPLAHPIVPHRNATMKESGGLDSYNKGAYVLHMLRYLIGAETLSLILSEFISVKKRLPHNQATTQDFIDLVHSHTNLDLNWFFNLYLYQTNLPVLNKRIKYGSNHTFVELDWENPGFKMPLEIKYYTNTGVKMKKLSLTNNPTIIPIIKQSKVKIDPMSWVLLSLSESQ